MPEPTTEIQSEPSTVRLPQPIRTQLSDPIDSLNKTQTPPPAGPGGFDPAVIPPSHNARTIILCFDGSGDQFVCVPLHDVSLIDLSRRSQNSNIIQLFSRLKKDDMSQQVVYLQVCSSEVFVLVRRFKCSILGWHRDVHDF
jgi:uncharacterized protein (DUF2235 family)